MGFSTAGGGSFSTGPKMNVTPLIDVLLVLIIVFMVVVIEQRPAGLQTELPQQPKSTDNRIPPPQATIVIQIHHAKPGADRSQAGHPEVMVNEEVVDWDQLQGRLRDIYAIRVERIAYLKADDDIDFQDLADVISIARIAGVDRIGLLTEDGKHSVAAGLCPAGTGRSPVTTRTSTPFNSGLLNPVRGS
jgi:biopolymer transport protein ExbD